MVDYQTNIVSRILNGRISFSSNDTIEPVSRDSAYITAMLKMTVRASDVPELLQELGPHQVIDATMLGLLNYDFRAQV